MCWKIAKLEVLLDYWVFSWVYIQRMYRAFLNWFIFRFFSFWYSVLSNLRYSTAGKSLSQIGIPLAPDEKLKELKGESTVPCPEPTFDFKPCHILSSACLFYLATDPCEKNNLIFRYPDIVKLMDQTLDLYRWSTFAFFEMLRKWFYTKAFTSSDRVGQQKDVLLSQANWTLTHR